jgi:hypothetical protein
MSIKKFGQDGEYHHFFHKKKFLLLHFSTLKPAPDFCHFLFTKNHKNGYFLHEKLYYIPRTHSQKKWVRFQKVRRIVPGYQPPCPT